MARKENPIYDWRLWGWLLAVLLSGLVMGVASVEDPSNRLAHTNVDTPLANRE